MSSSAEKTRDFYRVYDLVETRKKSTAGDKAPASHQNKALQRLEKWYNDRRFPEAGAILVLPTGGGKTFTATRFLARQPLSDAYKVLWLAQTHHLLEQALDAVGENARHVLEPRRELAVRIVSATPGHFPVHSIEPTDDVVIATLQTICNARKDNHSALRAFLESSQGRLFVVFDEAHHAPAPGYRRLIQSLREQFPEMYLLGLTATPTYTDESKRGWLTRLFPQGIIYQVSPNELMASGILAKPIAEEPRTGVTPRFDEREYQTWMGTYRDLPEHIIDQLAENRDRNAYIATFYADGRAKYGKTIMFCDRWYQCEQISEFLRNRGIRTGAIYSHVDASMATVMERNRRAADENAAVLRDFRAGNLDVLLNVKMLTEGTDVPDVQTVFLTRRTTSQILITQMVGRALRGPKFKGTPEAFIVSFVDNWTHLINFAGFDPLLEEAVDVRDREYGKRPPIELISIALVQQLARQMDTGINMTPGPFSTLLPLGWYRVEFQTRVQGSDDLNTVRCLVLVLENERGFFQDFMDYISRQPLEDLADVDVEFALVKDRLDKWQSEFFSKADLRYGSNLESELFAIARHIAQNGLPPLFFLFEEREHHDLDAIAKDFLEQRLDPLSTDDALRLEYNRTDRLWRTLYFNYDQFKSQCDACVNRLLHARRHDIPADVHGPVIIRSRVAERDEPSEEVKQQVKERDGRCLCCGERNKRLLQVDHISPHYRGGGNELDNLQTLCRECNRLKGTTTINLLDPQTDLTQPPTEFNLLRTPIGGEIACGEEWEKCLRRAFSFFYRCGAVQSVRIGARGRPFYLWEVELKKGNDPTWLSSHLQGVLNQIRATKMQLRLRAPDSIRVFSPDMADAFHAAFVTGLDTPSRFKLADSDTWRACLQRTVNRFFSHVNAGSRAVDSVTIPTRGLAAYNWTIEIKDKYDPEWLRPHLPRILEEVQKARKEADCLMPQSITLRCPNRPDIVIGDRR